MAEAGIESDDLDVSAGEILRMSSPEWHLIGLASASAAVAGLIQPLFALLMTEIIGVSQL